MATAGEALAGEALAGEAHANDIESDLVMSESLSSGAKLVSRTVRELQDFNSAPKSQSPTVESSRRRPLSRRSETTLEEREKPNRLTKELASFNEEPPHEVAMTEDNLEIAGVWQTRYTQKVLNHKDRNRPPSPPKNLNVKRMIKDQVLPKNKIKDPNAFGGAGVPVTHALDDSEEGSKEATQRNESSEGYVEGSSESVNDEAEGDSTYRTHGGNTSVEKKRSSKQAGFNSARQKAGRKGQTVDSYTKDLKKAEVLYREWSDKKSKFSGFRRGRERRDATDLSQS